MRDDRITQVAKIARNSIAQISEATLLGSEHAAIELYNLARVATETLDFACRMKTALFRAIAKNKFSLPVLLSLHRESISWTIQWLEILNLGRRTGINLSRTGKEFSYTKPANQVAIYLYELAWLQKRVPIDDWNEESLRLLRRECRVSLQIAVLFQVGRKSRSGHCKNGGRKVQVRSFHRSHEALWANGKLRAVIFLP